MIAFFYVTEDSVYLTEEAGYSYKNKLLKADPDNLQTDKIYLTTPSDLQKKMESDNTVVLVGPQGITDLEGFPQDIGFQNFSDVLKKLEGKKKVRIAIINGMSLAYGDHLIGMQAFDYWYEKMLQHFEEVEVNFYQLDPHKLYPITLKWYPKVQHLFLLPNSVQSLMTHDAFITLGSILIRETFDQEPMVDFFLRALSIDPTEVPESQKRIKYTVHPEIDDQIEDVFRKIRAKKRPILLFHHKSTASIRQMSKATARRLIREVINLSDYYVISVASLEYLHARFLDISRYSQSFDHFASIISRVDGIVTVDTVTYHLADAFDIPTVALFTTIDPNLRVRYYPCVVPIMLENTKGWLYGRHKQSLNNEKEEVAYVEEMWSRLDGKTILGTLQQANYLKWEEL